MAFLKNEILGNDGPVYPIQALSFLATYQNCTDRMPLQSVIISNRETLVADIRVLEDAIHFNDIKKEFLEVVDMYGAILLKCLRFEERIRILLGTLRKAEQTTSITKNQPPHPSLYAIAYLCLFGKHMFSQSSGRAPFPTDIAVENVAEKMLDDMSRIATKAGSCTSTRYQYVELQASFDDILDNASIFADIISDMHDGVPGLV